MCTPHGRKAGHGMAMVVIHHGHSCFRSGPVAAAGLTYTRPNCKHFLDRRNEDASVITSPVLCSPSQGDGRCLYLREFVELS